MPPKGSPSASDRPSRDPLGSGSGHDGLSVRSLLDFCAVPPEVLSQLERLAQPEDWGTKGAALIKYLAVHVPLAMEQGRYAWNKDQIILRAGSLATAHGLPIYLGLVRNAEPAPVWALTCFGERPGTVEELQPADLGAWPPLDPGKEIALGCDLSNDLLRSRLGELAKLPLVLQTAVVSGAVAWSIRRGLAVRQLHGEGRAYFVPVHLASREGAPELVAAIQVQSERLVVRTLLEPLSAYAPARAVATRRADLPEWLLGLRERAAQEN